MNKKLMWGVLTLTISFASMQGKNRQKIRERGGKKHEKTESTMPDIPQLEKIIGKKGVAYPDEGVVSFSIPRTDSAVTIQHWPLDPFMGTPTWFSFQKGKKPGVQVMMMGNVVLREHEVQPALDAAINHNIEVSALHNHLYFDEPVDEPELCFMHIEAEGDTDTIARGCMAILDAVKSAKPNKPLTIAKKHAINGAALEKILDRTGVEKDGMFKIIVGRTTHAGCGCPIGSAMGINSWAAFDGTMDNALIDGDVAVLEDELNPVLKELKKAGMNVTAIHNRMIHEEPRMMYIHFWGNGKAADLAHGFKKALSKTNGE